MGIQPMFTPDVTLADAVRLLPQAASVFEQMEIDYSCQGRKSLTEASRDAGYRVEEVIERLHAVRTDERTTDWFEEPIPALIDFLTSDHRSTLDEQLPALRNKIDDTIKRVGDLAELRRIRVLFNHLSTALSTHVLNEERELFPFIEHLNAANNDVLGAPRMRISQRVLRELVEHATFRDRLRTLNELAQRLPANETVSSLRSALHAFSDEVGRHMHLENNVLYPRAIEIENGLRRTAAAGA